MRDPLSWVPIRYKLPLAFVFLCLVVLGLGGFMVARASRESLHQQIEYRLDERADAAALAVERSLELLTRRAEDFASDGFIRAQFEELLAAEADAARGGAARKALARHLETSKLPLGEELAGALLRDAGGRVLLSVGADGVEAPAEFGRQGLWLGPIHAAGAGFPWFLLSAPVTGLAGGERLGYLQIVVRADIWAAALGQDLTLPGVAGFTAELQGPDGDRLWLGPPGEEHQESGVAWIRSSRTLGPAGWRLDLGVDERVRSLPLAALLTRFIYLGVAIVVLTGVMLFFPRQFLLKPLSALQEAARRLAEGDFSARVRVGSRDEVGDLAEAFNFMAAAVEERTRKLEQSAGALKRREADIRFERDRLNTVIRSMEDGLFILDPEGSITLSNAAARPVIAALSEGGGEMRLQCRRQERGRGACLHCISNFDNEVQGCILRVGERIFEINGAVFAGSREAAGGKVFVSRDVTARVRQSEQMAHQERLSVLGEIAAVMAHELNNPLAAISMFSQMLLKGLENDPSMRTHAEVIHRNTEICKVTIRALLDLATTSSGGLEPLDAGQLIEDVTQLLEPVAHRAGVSLAGEPRTTAFPVLGNELQLRQALVNLVMNGIQACGDGGRVTIASDPREEGVALVVEDDGPGIPATVRDHIFEPFFTTKPPGEGTGLGLSTSRRIVESQGGNLILARCEAGCTRFEIVLPRPGEGQGALPGESPSRSTRLPGASSGAAG